MKINYSQTQLVAAIEYISKNNKYLHQRSLSSLHETAMKCIKIAARNSMVCATAGFYAIVSDIDGDTVYVDILVDPGVSTESHNFVTLEDDEEDEQ